MQKKVRVFVNAKSTQSSLILSGKTRIYLILADLASLLESGIKMLELVLTCFKQINFFLLN
jgi:hypothetical protein